MALGFIVAISWAAKRGPRFGVSSDFINNLATLIVIAGIVGGRVSFLAIEESVDDVFSWRLFEVWTGGMVFYGGFIAAVLASIIYCRMKNQSFMRVADTIVPALALAHFFGRLGCLMAGCCFGKQCELPWAITFTNPLSLAPLNVRLHPTQLYEALGNLVIVGILLLIQKRQKFSGQLFSVYLTLYAVLRASVEVFRGDVSRGFVTFGGLIPDELISTSTFISGIMIAVAVVVWIRQRSAKI